MNLKQQIFLYLCDGITINGSAACQNYAALVSHLWDRITTCKNTAGHWPAEPDATILLANGHVG